MRSKHIKGRYNTVQYGTVVYLEISCHGKERPNNFFTLVDSLAEQRRRRNREERGARLVRDGLPDQGLACTIQTQYTIISTLRGEGWLLHFCSIKESGRLVFSIIVKVDQFGLSMGMTG